MKYTVFLLNFAGGFTACSEQKLSMLLYQPWLLCQVSNGDGPLQDPCHPCISSGEEHPDPPGSLSDVACSLPPKLQQGCLKGRKLRYQTRESQLGHWLLRFKRRGASCLDSDAKSF